MADQVSGPLCRETVEPRREIDGAEEVEEIDVFKY
jgi:hypothetical protein